MKKVILAVLLVVGMTAFAQGKKGKFQDREKLAPEQKVEKQVEKMTTDLSLNDKQAAQIKALLTKESVERESKRAEMQAKRAEGTKPSQEERAAMKEKMDEKINDHKAEMKKILTADQYAKWEKNMEQRKEKMQDRMKNKKKRANNPE